MNKYGGKIYKMEEDENTKWEELHRPAKEVKSRIWGRDKNIEDYIKIFKEVFPNISFISYIFELRKILKDCRTVLDLGCGDWSPISFLDFEYTVGVDACESSLIEAKNRGTHDEYYLYNIREIDNKFSKDSFDCCVAMDAIEHLSKEDGLKLIKDMELIASKKVVIFTPNSYILPYKARFIDLEDHLSLWSIDEMEKFGYKVIGIYGEKLLRGKSHGLRFHPRFVWAIVSELTHRLYARSYPKRAAAILCHRDITRF